MRPSEMFLKIWRYRSQTDQEETPEDFALCAEAWAQIRALEELQAWETERTAVPRDEEVRADQFTYMEEAPGDPSPAAPDDGGPIDALRMTPRERKRQIRDRILRAREQGFTAAQIAEAAGGSVTDDTVFRIINAVKTDIRAYERIDLALDKLMGKEECENA